MKQLKITIAEVEELLVGIIIDGKIAGKIDQQKGILELLQM